MVDRSFRVYRRLIHTFAGLMATTGDEERGQFDNGHRILVIGKAGNGKSALCNALTGTQQFPTGRSFAATTRTMNSFDVIKFGRRMKVVDTPDITNCDMIPRDMEREVFMWMEVTRPYPTAVLLTVRCDVRYTPEEYAIYKKILSLWADDSLRERLVVAFTFGDCLDRPIEDDIKHLCPELTSVLKDAGGHYIVFNDRAVNKEAKVQELLNLIESSPPNARPPSRITRALMAGAAVSGLCFAAFYTADKTAAATVFGLMCLAATVGVIFLRIKERIK